jgi:chromosomal replication initiation ATPase DnaA
MMRDWIVIEPPHAPGRRPIGSVASLNNLLSQIAAQHGYTLTQIQARSRVKALCAARQAAMVAAYATGRWSGPSIGRALHRDHSTVFHAVWKARALAQQEVAA